jgi:sugar phosphate isomerase/epimerase
VTTQTRRSFLATIGSATVGLATGCRAGQSTPSPRTLQRIGLQLYTVRNEMQRDVPATLARVAAIGYKEVEFAGYFNRSAAEIRDLLQRNNLTAPSTHVGLDVIESQAQKTFADAKTIGHEWLTVPSLSGRLTTVDDCKAIAKRFNTAGASAKAAGLRFAFHNHNAEFRKIGDVVPFDVFLQETDPALVSFEMDLYWVVNAGADPLAYIARFPGRFRMVHVKDSMGPPDHKMVEVGAGKIDFKKIFAQSDKAGIEHYFVEHDQPADPMASIEASYRYLSALQF